MGVDVIHLNLHKTFSTPHGGGGPGCGPCLCSDELAEFLPTPRVEKKGDAYRLNYDYPNSIGRVKAFHGNFGMMVRALSYIYTHGAEGLKEATETAVLNARYLSENLKDTFHAPYASDCMHEAIFSHKNQSKKGVVTLDIAKRLIDYGFHPMTVYFPLVVEGAMLIEPTESVGRADLDAFVEAMKDIDREAQENPELVINAPHSTRIGRLDEATAARKPILRWKADMETTAKAA
jgi:glycine dehydrogenase subunit 2